MNCIECSFETSNKKFCSRSCANKHNNSIKPKRKLTNICKDCKTPIRSQLKRCKECATLLTLKSRKYKICQVCSNEHFGPNRFCSNECYVEWKSQHGGKQNEGSKGFHANRYIDYIRDWKLGLVSGGKGTGEFLSNYLRRYIFEKYQSKCCECGWSKVNIYTGKIPLQVDHINGNWRDNSEENLRLICCNCHSLTSNYGSRNKGHGRPYKSRGK